LRTPPEPDSRVNPDPPPEVDQGRRGVRPAWVDQRFRQAQPPGWSSLSRPLIRWSSAVLRRSSLSRPGTRAYTS